MIKKMILGATMLMSTMAMADTFDFKGGPRLEANTRVLVNINGSTTIGTVENFNNITNRKVITIEEENFLFGKGNNVGKLENDNVHTAHIYFPDNGTVQFGEAGIYTITEFEVVRTSTSMTSEDGSHKEIVRSNTEEKNESIHVSKEEREEQNKPGFFARIFG